MTLYLIKCMYVIKVSAVKVWDRIGAKAKPKFASHPIRFYLLCPPVFDEIPPPGSTWPGKKQLSIWTSWTGYRRNAFCLSRSRQFIYRIGPFYKRDNVRTDPLTPREQFRWRQAQTLDVNLKIITRLHPFITLRFLNTLLSMRLLPIIATSLGLSQYVAAWGADTHPTIGYLAERFLLKDTVLIALYEDN